jgi:glycosyltransferase involved in cell wall biosynthesis
VLGWVGTTGALAHLQALAPVLGDVCSRHGARLRVVCDRPPGLPGVPVDFVPWSPEREVQDLLPIDVGLAPLADGPAARCKCGLKALQYMAAGAPVVAAPVGALAEIVEDGVTGLHAGGAAAWTAALDGLLGDRDLRLRLGAEARRRVASRWSFDVHAARFEAALRGLDPDADPVRDSSTCAG